LEERAGNYGRAMKHYFIAAASGDHKALEYIKEGFKKGHATKEEYASSLRAYQIAQEEVKVTPTW